MITEVQIIVRLLLAAMLGAAVGMERERQNQPAGLRTHIILVVGSTLAMTMSINMAIQFRPLVPNGDPARLAAQVVSGIGFLGAGAILRYGSNIKGLTTATSLWTMAMVGMAVGAGMYFAALAATLLLLTVLVLLNRFEKRFIRSYITLTVSLKADDRTHLVDDIKRVVSENSASIVSLAIKKNLEDKRSVVDLVVRTLEANPIDSFMDSLASIKGVRSFEINHM